MIRNRPISLPVIFIILVSGMLVSLICTISIGPVIIPFTTVYEIIVYKLDIVPGLIDPDWKMSYEKIIWNLRLPRVILTAVVGAILAVSGVGIQAVTRNSLANPYILGISSGASTGAVTAILMGGFQYFGQYSVCFGAFIGALVATALVFAISHFNGRTTSLRLILTGIAISAFFQAVTNYVVHSAKNEEGIRTAVYWMIGSFSGAKWQYLPLPMAGLILSAGLLLIHYRGLNAMLMGEETAATLGINTRFVMKMVILLVAVMTGLAVAVSGIIGFVGLVVPHIVRMIVGSDHLKVLPVSLCCGAVFMMWADALARILASPEELPVGIITSMAGAPFFLYLLTRNKYSFGSAS